MIVLPSLSKTTTTSQHSRRSISITVHNPLPPLVVLACLLTSLLSLLHYLRHPFSSLSCTRHPSQSLHEDHDEDHDCAIVRTLEPLRLPHPGREFLFEAVEVFLSYADSTAGYENPAFFVFLSSPPDPSRDPSRDLSPLLALQEGRELVSHDGAPLVSSLVSSQEKHHDHVYIQSPGSPNPDRTLDQMLTPNARFPCKTQVLLRANDDRVYSFFE
jgi:hypothetical protein